ncbi:MAG: hypothetical protein OES79_14635 [Planctomycetota bacterium]|nr:hypothetical protein [Planctomycetota bacterium]
MTITLPLPPKGLSPNDRMHWAWKAAAVKKYRSWSAAVTRTEIACSLETCLEIPWKAAKVQPVFYFKDRRRRDRDNLAASLKAAYDGLVDAGLLVDDEGLVPLPPEIGVDKDNPRVELILTRINGG